MESVIIALMILVLFMTGMKLTFLKAWQMGVTAVICALFVGLSWQKAIEQSNNEIGEWLADQKLMLDTSVVITIEVLWQVLFCMLSGMMLYGGKMKSRTLWMYRTLRFFPGILIFPILFYLLVQTIYTFPGMDFAVVAWSLATLVLMAIPVITYLVRWLLPEKSLRLELLFLCSALVLILGIIVTVNGTTSFKGSDPIEWKALLAFIVLLIICGGIGLKKTGPTPALPKGRGASGTSKRS